MEAAGQSGGSYNHCGRNAHFARGRRWIGGKFKGQQSPAGAAQSAGGIVDCMVHFLPLHPPTVPHFPSTFPASHVLSLYL